MDGLILPVGADLTALHQAFGSISASAVRMGQKINSSMAANQSALNPKITVIQSAFRGIEIGGKAAFSGVASAGQAAFASISTVMGSLGIASGIGGIGGAIALSMKSISSAADRESLEMAFTPLLGGADKAQARIKELSQFAIDTPFDMPEVARASRVLEVLTKGALSTGKSLTLVGDVASTTGQPFDELATWIGRLYDGLQSGRPVGEALSRLQELGVVSGDVRSKIEKLQKEGKKGPEVWGVAEHALSRFSGAMKDQSETWNGKMSNFKEGISSAMAEFGKPIMNALKPYLDSVGKMATDLGKSAADFGKKVGDSIKFISAAFSSGQLGALLGSSIKLGFINATNFLWRSLNGIFAAAGQYIIEYFRTGVEMFHVLTTPDFWKGMGNVITGVFLDTIEFFQKGLAAALEAVRPLAEMIGQGDKVSSAKSTLNESAGVLREEASARYSTAGGQLEPLMNQITARVQKAVANISARFATAFAGAGDIIDPTAVAADVRKLVDSINTVVAKSQAEIDAALAKQKKLLPKSDSGDVTSNLNAHIAPAVLSLTRIGGGGAAASVFSGLVPSVKSMASDLKQIVRNTKPTTWSGPERITAVYG